MADIFLSYSGADRAWVSHLVDALAQRGWSLFWDRQIPAGKQFDQVIQRELDAAKCIVVLWSRSSIKSNWVKDEAQEGVRRDNLCPVLIEDVQIPLGWRGFQTARLVDWRPGTPHPEFEQLMKDLATTISRKSAASLDVVDRQNLVGKRVQNYDVVKLIGEGGMGAVYLAVHPILHRNVAVKILRREYAEDQNLVNRFINEAKAANAIRHPGIVDVIDVGTLDNGLPYQVMEMLKGETLRARLDRGRLPVANAIDIGLQTATALAAAHDAGIVHRDVKPENLFLVFEATTRRDHVKVLDFGIAKLTSATGTAMDPQWTKAGSVMGTPPYMSPEQCRGAADIDHRTDIYAMGIILFEMLTGAPPFKAEGFGDLMMLHMTAPPPAPRGLNPEIPAGVEAAILKALEKRPEARFARMHDLVRALAEAPAGRLAETSGPVAVVGGTLVLPIPTTMTGAASQIELSPPSDRPPARTRLALAMVALAGMTVVGVVGGKLFSAPVPSEQSPPRPQPTPAKLDTSTPEPAAPEPAAPEPAAPEPPPPPAPKTYSVTVTVRPGDATVALDGARVGVGTFTRTMAADGRSHTLLFTRKGYANKEIEFGETTSPPRSVALGRLSTPAPTLPPAPPKVKVVIASWPPGADVCLASDRILLGRTELEWSPERAPRTVKLLLRKTGYRGQELAVALSGDAKTEATLEKLGRDDLDDIVNCKRK